MKSWPELDSSIMFPLNSLLWTENKSALPFC
jgi:hypothetical protein